MYMNPNLSPEERAKDLLSKLTIDEKMNVKINVENKCSYEIDESVLLFVKMIHCPITPFVKKLRNFTKINLKPNDKKTVKFTLTSEDFTYIDKDMKTAVNKGLHKIFIGELECEITI